MRTQKHEPSLADGPLAHREMMARVKGFESEPCPQCKNLTLRRDNSVLTCATCKERIYEISTSQWLKFIGHAWPDKQSIRRLLADNVVTMTREWPSAGMGVYSRMLADMGGEIERAESPQDCWDAFLKVLNYMACPEPGWDGVTLKVMS